MIRERLLVVFPEGVDGRSWAVADRAARSLFVFLYAFAVERVTERRVRPAMVTTMSDEQAREMSPERRLGWWEEARRPRPPGQVIPGRWYAENTREPIRDETFRVWKEYGALLEDALATTSPAPRYRLARDFADLFDPTLGSDDFAHAVEVWQSRHLTQAARARVALLQQQALSASGAGVRFPDGTVRILAAGPSTPLLKAAVELFAPVFMHRPIVLVVTESRRRLAYQDAEQLARIRLRPDPRVMPDLLLVDLEAPHGELQFVFAECVATGGAMTRERVDSLRAWLVENRFDPGQAIFGTVFRDRGDAAFRRHVGELAWGTYVWFASEPHNLMVLREGGTFESKATLDALRRTAG